MPPMKELVNNAHSSELTRDIMYAYEYFWDRKKDKYARAKMVSVHRSMRERGVIYGHVKQRGSSDYRA